MENEALDSKFPYVVEQQPNQIVRPFSGLPASSTRRARRVLHALREKTVLSSREKAALAPRRRNNLQKSSIWPVVSSLAFRVRRVQEAQLQNWRLGLAGAQKREMRKSTPIHPADLAMSV